MNRERSSAVCMYKSVYNRNFADVERLLDTGVNPNEVLHDKGINVLHLAVGINPVKYSEDVTRLILLHGGDPNKRSEDGMTPVHIAAAWGRLSILKMLLDVGGDPFLTDNEDKTPLYYAQENEHFIVAEYLLDFLHNDTTNTIDTPDKYKIYLDKVILKTCGMQGEYSLDDSQDKYSTIGALSKSNILDRWFENNINHDTEDSYHNSLKKSISPEKINTNKKEIINNISTISISSSPYESCTSINNEVFLKPAESEDSNKSNASKLTDNLKNKLNLDDTERHKLSADDTFFTGIEAIAFTKDSKIDMYSVFVKENEESKESITKSIYHPRSYIPYKFPDSPDRFRHVNYCTKSTLHSEKSARTDDLPQVCSFLTNQSTSWSDISIDFYGDRSSSELSQASNGFNKAVLHSKIDDDSKSLADKNNTKDSNYHTDDKSRSSRNDSKPNKSAVNELLTSITEEYKYEDEQAGVVLIEKRLLVTPVQIIGDSVADSTVSSAPSLPAKLDYDTDTLRKELIVLGIHPGPITTSTKRVYLQKLTRLKKNPILITGKNSNSKTYSIELEKTFRDAEWYSDLSAYVELENKIREQFEEPDPNKRWREGIVKSSFTYLLLDPRITGNLPCRTDQISKSELWKKFIDSIFYVGKGKRSRPYCHLYQAVSSHNTGQKESQDKKIQNILDIWNDNLGVVCLHIFQNVIPAEAYTREAAMIEVLGLKNLRNLKSGNYYGVVATWPLKQKKNLGVYLLYRAMLIFLNEGERQLRPADIG